MPAPLRINTKVMIVDSSLLNPANGCGQILAGGHPYRSNDLFMDCMRLYGFPNLFADRMAQRLLDKKEDAMRTFTSSFDNAHAGIEVNFRSAYEAVPIVLVLDAGRRAAHFVADAENRLALSGYYREAMRGVARALGITLRGWPERLVPVGWRNLYDVTNDGRFKLDYPQLEAIDVTPGAEAIEWHGATLELAASTLNTSDAGTIRHAIRAKADGQASGDMTQPPKSEIPSPKFEIHTDSGTASPEPEKDDRKPPKTDEPPIPKPEPGPSHWPEI